MDKQAAFDKAAQAVLAQGKPSASDMGTCQYRADDGCMCAIGHLLPVSAGDPVFGYAGPVVSLLDAFPAIAFALGVDDMTDADFLMDLQRAHDHATRWDFRDSFLRKMLIVATDYGLNPAALGAEVPCE